MGEYADDATDRDFNDWADDGFPKIDVISVPIEYDKFEYVKIVRETDKAWLLEGTGKGKNWFPKSKCEINKEKHLIIVPKWLTQKKIVDEVEGHK
jgi:hypothetical protein